MNSKWKLPIVLFVFQIVFLVLFGAFVKYDASADARTETHSRDADHPNYNKDDLEPNAASYYAMFQDVHVMMFVGFGFLMTFLKKYGYGAVGINFLIAAFVLQWATLMSGFLHLHDGKITINIVGMLTADFAAAAVLISFGSLLGKASPLQLIIMAFFEIIFFQVNEYVGLSIFKAVDVGGSMFVHVFGAYFGLTISRVLHKADWDNENEGAVYHSDIFAMIGTVFLWLFWPSFNSALAPGDDQHRAILNTYFSLAACCVVTFAVSAILDKHGKFDMVHVQNATLAGGVAVGTSADMMIDPWGAILIGMVAGTLSVIGYKYITPFLNSKLKIHDTCGVNNLHGMPGLLAAVAGAIAAALASTGNYGNSLYTIFPARAPLNGTAELEMLRGNFSAIAEEGGDDRTAGVQAGYQMAALALTLVIAIIGGLITGLILKAPIWDQPEKDHVFNDLPYWEVPQDQPLFPAEKQYRKADNGDAEEMHNLNA